MTRFVECDRVCSTRKLKAVRRVVNGGPYSLGDLDFVRCHCRIRKSREDRCCEARIGRRDQVVDPHVFCANVKDIGSGYPVVLIHGWPLTGDMFEYQSLALLEAGYRVITYDRRGFGQSGHPAGTYNYDVFADDLCAVLEGLHLERAHLVGFSMGGGEIARYLTRHGAGRVSKAVLIASVVPYLLKDSTNPDGVDSSVFAEMKEQVRADRFAFLQSFTKTFYGVGLVSKPVSQGILDWSFILGVMASPKATIDCIDAFGHTDFRSDLKSFTMPTLIIHGTSDETVPIGPAGRAAAQGIPGAQLIEYDGEPHGLFATVPNRLNRDLIGFLR